MRVSCLVNNYNYSDYVVDAVESALAQTHPFDEIIVVDDGSTDDSRERLQAQYSNHATVRLLFKENGGQLSCLNAGFDASSGDVIFFLDADDTFEPGYVAAVCQAYETNRADFVFTAHRKFGALNECVDAGENHDFGYTRLHTQFARKWIGGPTSCLSARREVLESFLPVPFLKDWRVCADACLIFGASLVGARKLLLGTPWVNYRIHARNNFHGKGREWLRVYQNEISIQRFFDHVQARQRINLNALAHLAWLEFCTKPQPTFEELWQYLRIFMGSEFFSRTRKLRYAVRMTKHLLKNRYRSADAGLISTNSKTRRV